MSIAVSCPHCPGNVVIPSAYNEKEAKCPHCDQSFKLPRASKADVGRETNIPQASKNRKRNLIGSLKNFFKS